MIQQRVPLDLPSMSNRKFDDTVQITLRNGHLSQPHAVAKVDKGQDTERGKAPCLRPDGTFGRYEAVLPFLEAVLRPPGYRS